MLLEDDIGMAAEVMNNEIPLRKSEDSRQEGRLVTVHRGSTLTRPLEDLLFFKYVLTSLTFIIPSFCLSLTT